MVRGMSRTLLALDMPRGPAPTGGPGLSTLAQLPVSFSRRAARASSDARVPSETGADGRPPVSSSEDEPESEEYDVAVPALAAASASARVASSTWALWASQRA